MRFINRECASLGCAEYKTRRAGKPAITIIVLYFSKTNTKNGTNYIELRVEFRLNSSDLNDIARVIYTVPLVK